MCKQRRRFEQRTGALSRKQKERKGFSLCPQLRDTQFHSCLHERAVSNFWGYVWHTDLVLNQPTVASLVHPCTGSQPVSRIQTPEGREHLCQRRLRKTLPYLPLASPRYPRSMKRRRQLDVTYLEQDRRKHFQDKFTDGTCLFLCRTLAVFRIGSVESSPSNGPIGMPHEPVVDKVVQII